jgi:serine protease AprX
MQADPRWAGRGVGLALVDSGFYPHPDLTRPRNRIRAWADASAEPVRFGFFTADETPRWPGWDNAAPPKWHGLMTSALAAGNGGLGHGFYRGPASEADLILVQVLQRNGRITNAGIARALEWLRGIGPWAGLRVVSLAVGGDPLSRGEQDGVHAAISALVKSGVTVIAAAGNDGRRGLIPPASSSAAITIGGIDDGNILDHPAPGLWHHSYGRTTAGTPKPELVAPAVWVAAPLLPGTRKAAQAADLFARRAAGQIGTESVIVAQKYLTPHYHHVDGTSVAASLVAGVAACMLEANPRLTPRLLRRALQAASRPVPGAPAGRQGSGALDAGRAVAMTLASPGKSLGPGLG